MDRKYSPETILVHGDYQPSQHNNARAVPIYQTAAFCYNSTDHAASLFAMEEPGFIYTRINNPTVDEVEKRIALLEGGIAAVATSSGMAAVSGFIFNMLKPGDEILAANCLYGGSVGFLRDTLATLGIKAKFVDPLNLEGLAAAITPQTRLIFVENLANPRLIVPDFTAIAQIAKEAGVPLVVDNTIATPYLSNPLQYGADFVIHSCTKYMEGHGSIIGGIVVDGGTYEWKEDKFPLLFEAAPGGKSFVEQYGALAFTARMRNKVLMNMGGCMSPFHAFLLLHGLEALHVRMERHCENASKLAEFLANHPKVGWVCYPELENHISHLNAEKYLRKYYGAMLGFGIKGGYEACRSFIDQVQLLSHCTNIGDTKTLVIHPASTTHRMLSPEERLASGISDDFIRVSVGLENAADLIQELERALEK